MKINDDERRLWVLNDEGLHNMFLCIAETNIRAFIRAHRPQIDAVITAVVSGRKPAHYLAYENPHGPRN